MTMYDKLIEWMRYCADDKPICEKMEDCPFYDESENNNAYYLCGERMLKKAADAIEELLAEREENYTDSWKMAFEVERDTHRWIPVTERFPNCNGCYLVWRPHFFGGEIGMPSICYFDGSNTWHDSYGVDFARILHPEDVTHWMPLPQPPESEVE